MSSPDPTWVAHVAEVLENFHGTADYETAADYASALLVSSPTLREMVSQYANGDAGREWLVDAVATAVAANTVCPTCYGLLESRGPFDGRLESSGVKDGHEGFGEVYQCERGHWFTWIQGKLVGASEILTIIERGTTP